MSLNVPPAEGVSPADAAKELRQILRDAYRWGKNAPDVSHLYIQARTAFQSLAYGGRAHGEIMELLPIARRRRPSETRKRLEEMWAQGGSLFELQHTLNLIRHELEDMPHSQGVSKDTLRRAYALVQVIPSYNDLPQGKEENILRAIMAIIKAHYGIIEGGPEQLPNVVSHLLSNALSQEKEDSQAKEIWTPIPAPHGAVVSVAHELEPDPYPQGPFVLWSPKSGKEFNPSAISEPWGDWNTLLKTKQPGDHKPWKKGNCTFLEAIEVLKSMRWRYSTPNIVLMSGGKKLVEAKASDPEIANWTWHITPPPEVSNAKNQPQENINTSTNAGTYTFNVNV